MAHIILLMDDGGRDLSFLMSEMELTVGPVLQVYIRDELVTSMDEKHLAQGLVLSKRHHRCCNENSCLRYSEYPSRSPPFHPA